MPGLRPDSGHPVHPPVAPPTVEQEPSELALQFGLRAKQLHPQAFRRGSQSRLVARVNGVSFLDDSLGVSCPVSDGVDGALEDLALIVP
jgi:hypothetical protein